MMPYSLQQAGKLHEHGDIGHSFCDVHAVLASTFWNDCGNICPPFGYVLDECMWCSGMYLDKYIFMPYSDLG